MSPLFFPLFFRGRHLNFQAFIDIEDIFTSVDRGGVGHAEDPPGSAEKAPFLGGVFSAEPKRLDQMRWNFICELRGQFRTNFKRCALRGGSTRGESRRLGLHEGVLEGVFQNWPLRPRVPSAVYHRSKSGHVHTKRTSATRAQSCNFHPSGRHLPRGTPTGSFERGGDFWRMHRRSEKVSGGPMSRNGGGPKLENACPGLPFGHVTSTWRPKDGARRDASFGTPPHLHMSIFDQKKPGWGLTRTLFWRYDRNVALDESFPTVVALWKLFFSILDLFSTGRYELLPGWHFFPCNDILRRKRRYRGKTRAWHFFFTRR